MKKRILFLSTILSGIFLVVCYGILIFSLSMIQRNMPVFSLYYTISGSSMDPTISDGSTVYPSWHKLERGDFVIAQGSVDDEPMTLIKRVVGMPGDTIIIDNGQVFIDGELYPEDYLDPSVVTSAGDEPYMIHLSSHEYFVMGDNRSNSLDSRELGAFRSWQLRKAVMETDDTYFISIAILALTTVFIASFSILAISTAGTIRKKIIQILGNRLMPT